MIADNFMDSASADADDADASPSMLTAATLFVMTRFVEMPSAHAAADVLRHLEIVAEDERGDPLMREICMALAQRWQGHIYPLCAAHQNQAMTHH